MIEKRGYETCSVEFNEKVWGTKNERGWDNPEY